MIPDLPNPPGNEIETRLTALLLGELPEAEALALRRAIEQDARLAALYDRLKQTIELVRQTAAGPAEQTATQPAPLKLSDERRQKLFAHFNTVAPEQFKAPRSREPSWIVPLSAAAALMLLAAIAIPNFTRARTTSQANAIMNNLRQLDSAKQQWALEEKKTSTDVPTLSDLKPYLGRSGEGLPPSVMGETYKLGSVSEPVTAELDAAQARKSFGGLANKLPAGSARGRRARLSVDGELTLADNNAGIERERAPFGRKEATPANVSTPAERNKPALKSYNFVVRSNAATAKLKEPANGPEVAATPTALPAKGGSAIYLPPSGESVGAAKVQLETRLGEGDSNALVNQTVNTVPPGNLAQNQGQGGGGIGGGGIGVGGIGHDESLGTQFGVPRVNVAGGTPAAPAAPARADTGEPVAVSDTNWLGVLETPATNPNQAGNAFVGRSPVTVAQTSKEAEVLAPTLTFKNEGKVVASAPQKVPVLSDVAAPGTTLGPEDTAAGIAARNPFGLKPPPASPMTGGDLSRRNLAHTDIFGGDKLSQSPVPAPGQQAGKDVALMFDRNGKADQPQAGGRAVGEGGVHSVNGLGYVNVPTNRTPPAVTAPPPVLEEKTKLREVTEETVRRSEEKADETLARLNQPLNADQRGEIRRLGIRPETLKQNADERAGAGVAPLEPQKQTPQPTSAAYLKAQPDLERPKPKTTAEETDRPAAKATAPAPEPQPEVQTRDNASSTFSLNVSDVSFKLAAASLEKGVMPEPATVRSEEFINAFDYRDPEPPAGVPIGFAWERARYPFAHNRDLLRFSVKTAAAGRQPGRPLNLVLLLDNSGSMERADRVQIIHEALRVLIAQLQPQDKFSVVTFARTARLWVDGVPGDQAGDVAEQISGLTPQGGTNLEEAMNLGYQTALRHYLAAGINRVVLLTDGAANLGNVDPVMLKQKVEAHRKQGVALDCFGVGWEGFNDDLLEILSRNGDGRYGFINTPEEAATEFAGQLAGALRVAASDVKVQVEFNPARVIAYRQIGYAKHQLTKEQFRDNTVDAAEIGAAESGNALYVVEVNPRGQGPLAIARVRFKIPGTADYREHEWTVPYTGNAPLLEQSGPALRLAATATAFSEWLVSSPYAAEVTPDRLLGYLGGVPEVYGADARPKKLEWMIRQAKSISGK